MDYAFIYHDCVCFAVFFGMTTATFDAHIYREVVAIYILAGQLCRFYVDSGYYVPYTELQQRRCSPYATI
jgi:hypothetical protein